MEFKNVEGAYSAVRRASKPFGIVVGGRPCFVDYEEGTMKGSFRDSEGKLYKKETGGSGSSGNGGNGSNGSSNKGPGGGGGGRR